MSTYNDGPWPAFITGFVIGAICLFALLGMFPGNKWDRDGYERGVRDCQSGEVEVRIDTTLKLAAVRPCGGLVYRGALWQACVVRRLFIL